MREIKFKETWRRKRDGHIYQIIWTLSPEGPPIDVTNMHSNDLWEHVATNLYVGLEDKNGKEIYEGDIVTHKFNEIGEVVEDIRRDCFVTNSPLYDGVTGYSENTAEVIGNIHENPELVSGRG